MPRFATNRLDLRSPSAFAESAKHIEALGFAAGLIPSSPLLVSDPYVMLATALTATNSATLGTLIENPVMRHPAVIAGSAATVDRLAPGRTLVGLGVGDTAVRLMGKRPARVDELADATAMIRRLLRKESIDVGAAEPARLRHASPVPVWIAAQGPRTLRMAGRLADGVFLRVGTARGTLQKAIAQVRAGAREAGRSAEEVGISLVYHTVLHDDRERTDAVARAMAAGYYQYSPSLFADAGLKWNGPDIRELGAQVWPDFHHASDLVAAGKVVEFLPQAAMDAFCLHGDAAQVREQLTAQLKQLDELGVTPDLIVLHPVPMAAVSPNETLTLFAEAIVQRF